MARKTERRHEQGDRSRQRILEAALSIAAERGYDGTTVAMVTERTGLPASSIYWHFKNKDVLLAETLEFSYRQWRETAPTWIEGPEADEFPEQVRDRLHRAGRALSDSPEFWRMGLMLALGRWVKEPAAKRRFIEVREETQDAIVAWWKRILPEAATVADPGLPRRLARFHLAVMDGLYIGVCTERSWDVSRMVDLLTAGMLAHVERRERTSP